VTRAGLSARHATILRVSSRANLSDDPLHDDDVAMTPGALQVRRKADAGSRTLD
jgi:hypothetical protein